MSILDSHIGELAALGTAVCWVFTAIFFEAAGKRIGSLAVNLLRLVLGWCFLALLCWATRGHPLPVDAGAHAWLWLSASGLVGLFLGDMCLFRAFIVLGPRLSALVMSLVPPLTAVIGWLFLGESLAWRDIVAIALTVTGVALAVTERHKPGPVRVAVPQTNAQASGPGHAVAAPAWHGVGLALGGALGQSIGLILSKHGMGEYSAVAATQIRVIAGLLGFAALFSVIGFWPRIRTALRHRGGLGFTALGALVGPVLGVTLSLYAVQQTKAGIAASITALTPVLMIPVVAITHHERVSMRGVLASLTAFAGVALLFT